MKLLITSILFFLSLAAQVKGQDTKLLATGTLNGGSIYAINVDGSPPEKWVDLSGGLYPHHSLIYYENKLWGMTRGGGAGGFGTIFNLDLDGSNYTKVHDGE